MAIRRLAWGVVPVCVLCLVGSARAQPPAPRRPAPQVDEGSLGLSVPVVPKRRLGAGTPPPEIPALPADAERIEPETVRLPMTRPGPDGRPVQTAQVVTRTVDRVHVTAAGGAEWLFARNPVDPRRVSGTYVDHASKTIVVYSDSDLVNMLGITGWAQVLTFGQASPRAIRQSGVERSLLVAPRSRFPAYREVDLSEWLEHPESE